LELREKVASLPLSPGVYLYKDAGGRVIYVGKAKSLRLRVRSYFSDDKLADSKTGTLISEARDVDYISRITSSSSGSRASTSCCGTIKLILISRSPMRSIHGYS
jgi:excinuclease UvrABC nuclease subunit